jgi:hypothetical protein
MKGIGIASASFFVVLCVFFVTLWPIWIGLLILYILSRIISSARKGLRARKRLASLRKSNKPSAYDEEEDFLNSI